MDKLTIVIDNWGHNELKDYLTSLKGIKDVNITNEKELQIDLIYDSAKISFNIIKYEILLFLDAARIPSIISFDRHPKNEVAIYKIIRDDICCEFCYKGAIEDLFAIKGIEKVTGNYYKEYQYNENSKIVINIEYNPSLLNNKKLQEIEKILNI